MTALELAQWLGGELEGEGAADLSAAGGLEEAGPRQVAFAAGGRAVQQVGRSGAGCVLVARNYPRPAGRTVIRVDDPRAAFARAAGRLHPPRLPAPGIHPSALVSPAAELGAGVSVGAYSVIRDGVKVGARTAIGAGCHLGENSSLGEDCLLHDRVTLYPGVEVGSRVILHSGAVLGADGFGFVPAGSGYEKFPQLGGVRIGDDVEIGANSCVDRAALGLTLVGDGAKLDNLVHIAHNVRVGRHVVIAAQTGVSGGADIGDHTVIAGQVGIGDKARIEARSVLGGQCGVLPSKIARAGQPLWGTPARPLREHLAQLAELGRIAELRREVAELAKRLDGLERGASDSPDPAPGGGE